MISRNIQSLTNQTVLLATGNVFWFQILLFKMRLIQNKQNLYFRILIWKKCSTVEEFFEVLWWWILLWFERHDMISRANVRKSFFFLYQHLCNMRHHPNTNEKASLLGLQRSALVISFAIGNLLFDFDLFTLPDFQTN